MYFYRNLYFSPLITNPGKAVSSLRRGDLNPTLFVIMLSRSPQAGVSGRVEFCSSINLLQKYYKDNPPYIIGIARGYQDSIETVRQIIQETWEKTGTVDVQSYLFPHGIRERNGGSKEDG